MICAADLSRNTAYYKNCSRYWEQFQLVKKDFCQAGGRGSQLPRHYHPRQPPLKFCEFPGAEPARNRFLLWKMEIFRRKIRPRPTYMPPVAIEAR